MKFIEHRVADRRILRLIQKWLKAGVSEDGQWSETKVGIPQGAVVSPLLANRGTTRLIEFGRFAVRNPQATWPGKTRDLHVSGGSRIFAEISRAAEPFNVWRMTAKKRMV